MQLITHRSHLDTLPASPLKTHITARFDQLSEDTDVPPNIILVENSDDITGPDYAFIGLRGLLSDLFDAHEPGHSEFARPYEWASHIPELHLYEVLLLVNDEDGYWIIIPETIVNSHPELRGILTLEEPGGLSEPQPL
jgi:hypothetical protein